MELQLHLNFLFHAYLTYVNIMVTVDYFGLIFDSFSFNWLYLSTFFLERMFTYTYLIYFG